ncbi:hypothetical protein L9F63_021300, partial [Diploptera punctata]
SSYTWHFTYELTSKGSFKKRHCNGIFHLHATIIIFKVSACWPVPLPGALYAAVLLTYTRIACLNLVAASFLLANWAIYGDKMVNYFFILIFRMILPIR